MKSRNKLITISIVCLIFGCLIGIQLGTIITLKAVASIAIRFVDEETIKAAIYQYDNHLAACYPLQLENASIYADKGN